ncbi:uncharacterized protein LOC114255464 [Monomorium pharaonis]|uniref:uncharacterized protein LOC114255464 n=1 Tax=Monomorium pharaonis TaxID=307658 RepID=UPI00102E21F0|nr:uncharacterized protein LOC114255464 [Monomorium pharaonis]
MTFRNNVLVAVTRIPIRLFPTSADKKDRSSYYVTIRQISFFMLDLQKSCMYSYMLNMKNIMRDERSFIVREGFMTNLRFVLLLYLLRSLSRPVALRFLVKFKVGCSFNLLRRISVPTSDMLTSAEGYEITCAFKLKKTDPFDVREFNMTKILL